MININSYVLKFGNRTFKKFPFNDVDGLVLAEISMINFDLLIEGEEPVALKDIVLKDYKKVMHFYIDEIGMDFHSALLYKKLK